VARPSVELQPHDRKHLGRITQPRHGDARAWAEVARDQCRGKHLINNNAEARDE
jgi:hypothetical protein